MSTQRHALHSFARAKSKLTSIEIFLYAASILVLAAWLRWAFVFHLHRPDAHIYSDMADYALTADTKLLERGRTIFFPPGFKPGLFYAWLVFSLKFFEQTLHMPKWEGFSLMQVLLSVASVILIWRASRKWFDASTSLIVLTLCAFHLPFILYTGFILAETLQVFLLALLLFLITKFRFPWTKFSSATLGTLWALASFVKSQTLFFFPIALWSTLRRKTLATWIPFACAAAIVIAAHSLAFHPPKGKWSVVPSVGALDFVHFACYNCRSITGTDGGVANPNPPLVDQPETYRCAYNHSIQDSFFFIGEGLKCLSKSPGRLLRNLFFPVHLFLGNEAWPGYGETLKLLGDLYQYLYVLILFPGLLMGFLRSLSRPISGRSKLLFALGWSAILPYFFILEPEVRFRVPFDVILICIAVRGWYGVLANNRKVFPRFFQSPAALLYGSYLIFGALPVFRFYSNPKLDFNLSKIWVMAGLFLMALHLLLRLLRVVDQRMQNFFRVTFAPVIARHENQ